MDSCHCLTPAMEYLARQHARTRAVLPAVPPSWKSEETQEWSLAKEACLKFLGEFLEPRAAHDVVAEKDEVRLALERFAPAEYRIPLEYWCFVRDQVQIEAAIQSMRLGPADAAARAVLKSFEISKAGHFVIVDSIPSSEVNASVRKFREPLQYVVLARWGLGTFLNVAAKALAEAWSLLEPSLVAQGPAVVDRTLASSKAARFLRRIMLCYYFWGESSFALHDSIDCLPEAALDTSSIVNFTSSAEAYPLPEPVAALAYTLESGMRLFVMGHEYGHILLGHDPKAGRQESWRQEYEADRKGLELMFEAMTFQLRLTDLVLAFSSAALFLALTDKLAEGLRILTCGDSKDEGSPTHPPTRERRLMLKQFFSTVSVQQRPLVVARGLEEVLEVLWRPIAEEIYALRQRGKRPHPSWYQ